MPIFLSLREKGYQFHVLQFTWGDGHRLKQIRDACEGVGVPYRSVCVWRRPVSLGSMVTAIKGERDIRRAVRDWNIEVVMPRSTLPLLSCLRALKSTRLPLVFDADGLPLDERVDFGDMSSCGLAYRLLRDVEAQGVRRADVVLTRTERAAEILLARAGAGTSNQRFYRVGNGRDASLFSPLNADERTRARVRLGIDSNVPLLVYAGSLGEQYCLPEMLMLFSEVLHRQPSTRFLILTGSPEEARSAVSGHKGLENKVVIHSVPPDDVPHYLASADLGLALRQSTFSMQGVAPIKLGEYLLCGIPIVASAGVGDTTSISEDIGCLVNEIDMDTLSKVADWFVNIVLPERNDFRSRCRKVGMDYYSLDSSVDAYERALGSLCQ